MSRSEFFSGHRYEFRGAQYAAQRVLSILREYVSVQSALDIGSGPGVWLSTWKSMGVERVLGIDNDDIQADLWCLAESDYQKRSVSEPIDLGVRFDVALSLEVAEHIEAGKADQFLQNLTRHSDVVLFSAAIPLQGGTGHVNEQWPEYWAAKFAQLGFSVLDIVRDRLWSDVDCPVWYAQNTLVFVSQNRLASSAPLRAAKAATEGRALSRVHPRVFEWIKYATQVLPTLPVTTLRLGADSADLNLVASAPAQLMLSERLFLYSLTRVLQPRRILEIGTGMGGSAAIMKQALTDAGVYQSVIVTVDPQVAPNVLTPEMHRFLFASGLPIQWDVRCEFVQGTTPGALEGMAGPFQLVFLDGEHSYAGVLRDLQSVHALLAPDGYLLMHDTHFPEIARAIDEALQAGWYRDWGIVTRQVYQYDDGVTAMPWAGLRLLRLGEQVPPRAQPAPAAS